MLNFMCCLIKRWPLYAMRFPCPTPSKSIFIHPFLPFSFNAINFYQPLNRLLRSSRIETETHVVYYSESHQSPFSPVEKPHKHLQIDRCFHRTDQNIFVSAAPSHQETKGETWLVLMKSKFHRVKPAGDHNSIVWNLFLRWEEQLSVVVQCFRKCCFSQLKIQW